MTDSDDYKKGWEDGLDRALFELHARRMFKAEGVIAQVPRIPSGWSGEEPDEDSELCPVADEIATTTMGAFRLIQNEDRRRDLLVDMFNEAYRMGVAKGRSSPDTKSFHQVDPYELGYSEYYRQITKKYPDEPHSTWSELTEDERSSWRSGFEEFERATRRMKSWLLEHLNENRALVGNPPLASIPDVESYASDAHTEHCCTQHGCKYGDSDCTVTSGKAPQSYPCEDCPSEPQIVRRSDGASAVLDSVIEAARSLVLNVRCHCNTCWTDRQMHDPKGCAWEEIADLRAAVSKIPDSSSKPFRRPPATPPSRLHPPHGASDEEIADFLRYKNQPKP